MVMTVGPAVPFNCASWQEGQRPAALAIDDNSDNLLVLEYTLDLLGFRFLGEMDAMAGLASARKHQPDVILVDILLPGIDGIEFMEFLQQEVALADIPVIAVTGLASDEDRDRILQAGFTDYICKPFMLEELETIIRRHVRIPAHLNGVDRLPDSP
jgi:CheY-like chemotaxis protein